MVEHTDPAATASYSLMLSEQERTRYRMMAKGAAENEAAEWSSAGIRESARIADVGCGPGDAMKQWVAAVCGMVRLVR
jgi:hypothetical protein